MDKQKLGQEPVIPMFNSDGMPSYFGDEPNYGMSKRFYAACAAMQGMLSNPTNGAMYRLGLRSTELSIYNNF